MVERGLLCDEVVLFEALRCASAAAHALAVLLLGYPSHATVVSALSYCLGAVIRGFLTLTLGQALK